MRLRVLGHLEAWVDDVEVSIGTRREQALLGVLAASAPTPLSRDVVIDRLWGDDVPVSAANAVQVYVSKIRRVLGRGVIATTADGYELGCAVHVDAWDFVCVVDTARTLLARGEPHEARAELDRGLALWRGPAYAGMHSVAMLAAEAERLDQVRLTAQERRIDALLASDAADVAVDDLDALTREHPLRERFWAQRMRALYLTGRQAESLAAYRQARDVLADELGIEPGPELRRLERAVLEQDPALENHSRTLIAPLPSDLDPTGPPLLGRAFEIARLVSVLGRAQAGSAEVVLLEGPPRIGKTRLVGELVRIARAGGVNVLHGRGVEGLAMAAAQARGPVLAVADAVETLPAAAAPQLSRLLAQPRPGRLVVLCGTPAAAPAPVRAVLDAAVRRGSVTRHVIGPMNA